MFENDSNLPTSRVYFQILSDAILDFENPHYPYPPWKVPKAYATGVWVGEFRVWYVSGQVREQKTHPRTNSLFGEK
ncbi:MAG: hypothetical protein N2235_16280 [Fischerella sp.]|nr:hypothetical protein [Fischerella sp.]